MAGSLQLENKRHIFVIEDDKFQTEILRDFVQDKYLFEVKTYETGEDAMNDISKLQPEIMVLDYHLSSQNPNAMNGIDVLKEVKKRSPQTKVFILSGKEDMNVAIESMKHGAYDYIIKGESSFKKIENTIDHLSEIHKLESINHSQKRTIAIFAIAIVVFIVLGILYAVFDWGKYLL